MTHPEDTALRLAEAATEGPWAAGLDCVYVVDGYAVGDPDAPDTRIVANVSDADAAHIAHAHPGRVRAYALCVARLRLVVAQGHMSWCKGKGAFGDGDDCTCGHDLDLAALAAVDAEG